jgi:hypothetical protein
MQSSAGQQNQQQSQQQLQQHLQQHLQQQLQQQAQQQAQQQHWVAQQGPQQLWQPAAPWMQSQLPEPERQEPRIRLRTSAAVEELAALQRRRRRQEELKGSSICTSLLLQQQQEQAQPQPQPQLDQQQLQQQPPPSQTMMRSSTAAVAVAPVLPTWQREHDMPHRRVLIQHMYVHYRFPYCFLRLRSPQLRDERACVFVRARLSTKCRRRDAHISKSSHQMPLHRCSHIHFVFPAPSHVFVCDLFPHTRMRTNKQSVRILNGRNPSTSATPEHAQLVPDVAKTLEATLYREAPSLEAYTCRATLVDRLKRIAAANQANEFAIMRSTMTGGRTNSISSSSTNSSTGLDQLPPPGTPPVPAQHQHEFFQPPQLQHQQQGRRPSWSISGGSGVPNHGGGSSSQQQQQQQHPARRGSEHQSNQQQQQLPPVVASAVPPPLLSQPGEQQQSHRLQAAMSTTMRKDDNSTSVRGDFSPPQPDPSIAAPATLPPLNPLTTLPASHVHMPQYLSTGSSSAGAAVTTATTISLRTPAGSNKDMRPSLLQESPEMAEPVNINQATTAANNNDNNDAMVGEAATTTASTPAAAADSVMPSICCICLQSVLSGSDSVGATSCGHCYHTDCFEIKKAKLFHPLYRDMLTVREKEEDDNDEYDGDDDGNNNDEETDTEQEEEGGHEPDDTDGEAHGPETICRNNDGDSIAVGGGAKRKRGEEERTGSTTDVEGDIKKHAVAEPMEDVASAATSGKKQQLPSSPDESLDVSAPPVKLAKYKALVRRQSEAIAALKQQVARLKRGERDQQSTNDQLKRRLGRKEMEIKRLVGNNDSNVRRSTRAELILRSNLVHIAAIKEKMEQDLLLLQKQT